RFHDIAVRIGMGFVTVAGSTTDSTPASPRDSLLTVPLTLSYLLQDSGKNIFELGAGATLYRSRSFFNNRTEPTLAIVPTAFVGFRSQARRGGFVLRAGFAFLVSTSQLDFSWSIIPWPYLAMGGAFE
ncbi:MAG TPA: hypothetical protein VNG33_00460, partial [Polyangiaceae bacterium]|nr:hypothetical protein [Polyangiaceae bacterium]